MKSFHQLLLLFSATIIVANLYLCHGQGGFTCPTISELQKVKFKSNHKEFATKLYKLALEKSEDGSRSRNLIFSPSSISLVLGMLYEGSQFRTRSEIKTSFLKTVQRHHIKRGFSWLTDQLESEGKQYELRNANAIFVEETFPVLQKFMRTIENCFSAVVENKDFISHPEQSRQQVNQWVEEQTEDKIQDLLPENSIDSLVRLILVNAIYFKGDWLTPFDTENGGRTSKGVFYPDHGVDLTQQVDMMTQTKNAYYHRDPESNVTVLGLPYKGKELTMFFILPKDQPLSNFEGQHLNGEKLKTLMTSAESSRLRSVAVTIPKFKMSHEVKLKEVLQAAGIQTMFKEGEADFRKINADEELYVSNAFHKAVIEVNEKGTEAAAATAAVMSTRSGLRSPQFTANRPFLYLLRHDSTDTILFMGRFGDVEGLDEQT